MDVVVFAAVLAAALLHAGWNAVVKVGLDRFGSILLLALVQSALALSALPAVATPSADAWPWIAASAILHTGYKIFLIRAYEHGDLSLVYPLARGTAPLVVAIVAISVLGEALTTNRLLAVVAISAGIIAMIFKTGVRSADIPIRAVVYALGTAAFTASYTLVDGIGARISGSATGFTMWMFVGDGLCMCLYAAATRGRPAFHGLGREWRSGLAAGAMSLGSYWIAIWAFMLAPIALVAALRETSVLFALMIAALFLHERIGPWRWLGAAMICIGIALARA